MRKLTLLKVSPRSGSRKPLLASISSFLMLLSTFLLLGVATPVFGTSLTLATLLANQATQLVTGDKIFTNFRQFISFGTTDGTAGIATPHAPAATEILVSTDDPNANTYNPGPGIIFTDTWSVTAHQTIDTRITFDVLDRSGPYIHDVNLGSPAFGFNGDAQMHISETVTNLANGQLLAALLVDGAVGVISAHKDFATSVAGVTVSKDISLEGRNNGAVHLSGFTQNFSEVPEPGTWALLGLGLSGIAASRLRRRR